jgi:hypothetical protein
MRRRDRERFGRLSIAAVIAATLVIGFGSAARAAPTSTGHAIRPHAGQAADPRGIRTPDEPRYTVKLTSDADGFVWTGSERVSFLNADPKPLDVVWLRLWGNGLTGCTKPLGNKVTHVQGGTAGQMSVDCTALPVTLPQPLAQGDRAAISFELKVVTPDTNWRFGRIGPMALLGNALPILAIHDALGGWHLEPYTPNGESFYSQVADYDVMLSAPKSLEVPASGDVTSVSTKNGIRTTTIEAHDVRDFAWGSGPFEEEEDQAPTGVTVKVWWMSPISKSQADLILSTGMSAMGSHAVAYGAYPYDEIDVILGPFNRFGGMEYPQLVMQTTSTSVLVHELAHQWWFGIVGDDEYNEPWLDEAFATYATDLYYGRDGEGCQLNWPSEGARITNSMAYWDLHPGEYFVTVYGIGSCSLHDLGRVVGPKHMATFVHDYAVKHALGWSTTDAFKAGAQKVADSLQDPVDLTKFWKVHRIDDVP